jgi:hypothetical protein
MTVKGFLFDKLPDLDCVVAKNTKDFPAINRFDEDSAQLHVLHFPSRA